MRIDVYCDASYYPKGDIATIGVVVYMDGSLQLRSGKEIPASSNIRLCELRALNKAIGYIDTKQRTGYIPFSQTIRFHCDDLTLVEGIQKAKATLAMQNRPEKLPDYLAENELLYGLTMQLMRLEKNNFVTLFWISRDGNNSAHELSNEILQEKKRQRRDHQEREAAQIVLAEKKLVNTKQPNRRRTRRRPKGSAL
ncbi:hypothetical protein U6B65_03750 [Oscillospiraceae bacterium MB08-C2-2]|nr:hypothetical protein U6B65_03750 [Oscillospiraceae bacterium MB08-C2-2]